MSLIHSSGHNVYHDLSLVETIGNLFPRSDTYPEPQADPRSDTYPEPQADPSNHEPPISETVQEIQSLAGHSSIALSSDRMQDVDTGSNAILDTDGLDVASIENNLSVPSDDNKTVKSRLALRSKFE